MPLYCAFNFEFFFPEGYKIEIGYPYIVAKKRSEFYIIHIGENENDFDCITSWKVVTDAPDKPAWLDAVKENDTSSTVSINTLKHERLDDATEEIVRRFTCEGPAGIGYSYKYSALKRISGRIVYISLDKSGAKDKGPDEETWYKLLKSFKPAGGNKAVYTPISMPPKEHYQTAHSEMESVRKKAGKLDVCARMFAQLPELPYDKAGHWPLSTDEAVTYVEEYSQKTTLPRYAAINLGDTDMLFTLIPPGAFFAGGFMREDDLARWRSVPIKRRELSAWAEQVVPMPYPYYLSVVPVTQRQWLAMTGSNPSNFQSFKEHFEHPVENVSWNEVAETFLPALNEAVALGNSLCMALPDEMEWEYACKAGTGTFFNFGNRPNLKAFNFNGLSMFDHVHHPNKYPKNVINMTTPPGMYPSNAWGLYDMHGNVREWCGDSTGNYPRTLPLVSDGIERKITRGGSFNDFWENCVSFEHRSLPAASSDSLTGFRIIVKRTI